MFFDYKIISAFLLLIHDYLKHERYLSNLVAKVTPTANVRIFTTLYVERNALSELL